MARTPEDLTWLKNRKLSPKRIAQVLGYYSGEFIRVDMDGECAVYKRDSDDPFYVFFCLNGFTTATDYQITDNQIITNTCGDRINLKTGFIDLVRSQQ